MQRLRIGDVVGSFENGVLKRRGRVLKILADDVYEVGWETTGPSTIRATEDLRRIPIPAMLLTSLDLQVYGEGLTDAELRGGREHRITDRPWRLADDHTQKLRALLDANGFDATTPIWAEERAGIDGFFLVQQHRSERAPRG
jgi:hypothetical protein